MQPHSTLSPGQLNFKCLPCFICIFSVCLRVYRPVWFLLISGKDCPSISLCLPLARTRVFTVIPSVQASYIIHIRTPYIWHEFIESLHGSLRVIISTQVKVIQVVSLILKYCDSERSVPVCCYQGDKIADSFFKNTQTIDAQLQKISMCLNFLDAN